jgi:hypothetical protein
MAADRFDLEYPEDLSDRFDWLERQLGIDRGRLFQLLCLPKDEALSSSNCRWIDIISRVEPPTAERVEHLLTHFLSYFGYDTDEAARFSREFPSRVQTGEVDLREYIPDYQDEASIAKREQALINAILEEGPALLPSMATFLFSTSLQFAHRSLKMHPVSPT